MSPGDIYTMLEKGGLVAIATVAIVAWYMERKESRNLTKQVIELASAQVEAQVENKALIQAMKDVLTQVLNRL